MAKTFPAHVFADSSPPNQCLINEYKPGQGIMPHSDGPAYNPCVATLSLGSGILLKLIPFPTSDNIIHPPSSPPPPPLQVYLPANSLFVLKGSLYKDYMHGIDEVCIDEINPDTLNYHRLPLDLRQQETIERSTRISLTFRMAKEVKMVDIKKLFGKKRVV